MTTVGIDLRDHPVVSHDAWLSARTTFLAQEKEFTRLRDELSQQRRALPWERVGKAYVFDGPRGPETLAELFDKKSQLIVYHFMFSPEWDEGCLHCSFWADNFNGIPVHLRHRDTSFVAISRAPLAKIERFKARMGWNFKWVSSYANEFNFDYHVSFTPQQVKSGSAFYNYATSEIDDTEYAGVSVFYRDPSGAVFHTYSAYARGIDLLNGAYHYLDLAPKGRDEAGPEGPQGWVRFHDQYED